MDIKGHSETICPACNKAFPAHSNRKWKIKDERPLMWFVDAINQFEHFNEVTCPYCGNNFKSTEARLFGIFKSPYAVVVLTVILGLLVGIWLILTLRQK